MTRAKEEVTKITSIRLPLRLVKMVIREARRRKITFNRLIWQIIEDFLFRHGLMDEGDRRRPPIDEGD